MFLGRKRLKGHSQLPKKAVLGRLQAFRMYGGIDMSTSSLHIESTDSLLHMYMYIRYTLNGVHDYMM